MKSAEKPISNPFVVLREEFDDWAILFNPDTGHGFGLSPTGVYLWKLLDGEHPTGALLEEIRTFAEGVPDEVGDHIRGFINELVREGLVEFDVSQSDLRDCADSIAPHMETCSDAPLGAVSGARRITYEPPKLINLTGRKPVAHGVCMNGSGDLGFCQDGSSAGSCFSGSGPVAQCQNGSVAPNNKCCTGTTAAWVSDCHEGNCPTRCANCTVGGGLCSFGNYAGGGTTCQTGDGGT